jgi:hypothetical protein
VRNRRQRQKRGCGSISPQHAAGDTVLEWLEAAPSPASPPSNPLFNISPIAASTARQNRDVSNAEDNNSQEVFMQRYYSSVALAAGLCLAVPARAADPVTAFDGTYRGKMEQQVRPAGVAGEHPAGEEPCEVRRAVQGSISAGYVILEYHDWHRHLIHFRGQVTADGAVTAYHRNSDATYSPLTGHISSNQLAAATIRGRCYYDFTLNKM